MVLSYSPQHEGGTLHLPSPTHCHHFDATSTLIQLRRSLSRSPSKSPAFRLVTKPASPTARGALSPSPLSPHRHISRLQLPGIASVHDAKTPPVPKTPLGFDIPSQRSTRASVRKYSPLRASTTARTHLLRTPGPRRVLSESIDAGNATPRPQEFAAGPENAPTTSPTQDSIIQPPKVEFNGFGTGVGDPNDLSGFAGDHGFSTTPHSFNFLSDKQPPHLSDAPVKSSPLKRVDAPSKTDPSEGSSPSAKRRSLHGTSDFDIFDQFVNMQNNTAGRTSPEFAPASGADIQPAAPSPISQRATSLRKSTLQQRHQDRPMLGRARASLNLTQELSAASPAPTRTAMDSARNLPTRRNLFSLEPPPEDTAASLNEETAMEPPRAPARHPLSRTITQSSSGSDVAQDSPTHIPTRVPDNKRAQGAFARSLPIGLGRNQTLARQANEQSDGTEVSTPDTFKNAKPLPAAFMSTGLISKRTKFLQDQAQGEVKNMPDTPCKRPMPINPMAPGSTPAPAPRHTQLKRSQHSFGTPSTPFSASASRPTPGNMGKGAGIFGSSVKPLNRRGSFLSTEDEPLGDNTTRQSFDFSLTPDGNGRSLRNSIFAPDRDEGADDEEDSPQPGPPCKMLLSSPEGYTTDADGDSMMQESPSAQRRFNSLGALASYSGHRRPSILEGGDHSPSPTPQSRKSHTLPHIRTTKLDMSAQTNPDAPTSPLLERHEQQAPHTPGDGRASEAPPDPSGLSISGQAQQVVDFRKTVSLGASMPPPATPTASTRFQSSRLAKSSQSAIAEAQVDPSLTQRFDGIEMIGEGEFSSVLKVTREPATATPISSGNPFDSFNTASNTSPAKVGSRQIWAVKKARYPFKSRLDRLRRLKEVEVLQALGSSPHTVELVDHWEFESYLYIQTEFCEDGSLDKFLSEAGRAARLDDFRIWKILLEVGLGLKYVHDLGFIHLDLKPANILITFAGTLKIADFGLATSWPAQKGVDGEGDREYIGPEILLGKLDKPADIYALGLIMLEIAANVVLPDNGASWRRLRSGDMSDVPSLTSSSDLSVVRDASGRVIEDDEQSADVEQVSKPPVPILLTPPEFMASKEHPHSLDNMVQWMINPDPSMRPPVDQLLQAPGVQWVAERRRAGASIYEGTWGPADELFGQDAEMMDV